MSVVFTIELWRTACAGGSWKCYRSAIKRCITVILAAPGSLFLGGHIIWAGEVQIRLVPQIQVLDWVEGLI